MSKPDDRRLDGYLAGELSPEEQRALAQKALDDPELFDQLASAAMVNAAAKNEVIARRSKSIRVGWLLTGAAAAVAIIVAVIGVDRPRPETTSAPSAAATPSSPSAQPAAPPAAVQPVILTARLSDLASQSRGEFRSPGDASRMPKSTGVVVGIEDGEVSIDLGSLDGLAKGSEVQVVPRGLSTGASAAVDAGTPARLMIATVFRERSRGRIAASAAVQVGDRVDVPSNLQLSALLEHALARVAAGDRDAARAAATQAATVATGVSGAESADAMNELAAVLIDNRDYARAEAMLRRAQMFATGATAVRVTNNLGTLAALQGNRAAAESMYRSALTLAGTAPESESARRSIEKNLQDLGSTR